VVAPTNQNVFLKSYSWQMKVKAAESSAAFYLPDCLVVELFDQAI
jgi:hypothetical protein